jgi:hypothetical protein
LYERHSGVDRCDRNAMARRPTGADQPPAVVGSGGHVAQAAWGRARLAAIATRRAQHKPVPSGADPPLAVAGMGDRVAKRHRDVLGLLRSRHAGCDVLAARRRPAVAGRGGRVARATIRKLTLSPLMNFAEQCEYFARQRRVWRSLLTTEAIEPESAPIRVIRRIRRITPMGGCAV